MKRIRVDAKAAAPRLRKRKEIHVLLPVASAVFHAVQSKFLK